MQPLRKSSWTMPNKGARNTTKSLKMCEQQTLLAALSKSRQGDGLDPTSQTHLVRLSNLAALFPPAQRQKIIKRILA